MKRVANFKNRESKTLTRTSLHLMSYHVVLKIDCTYTARALSCRLGFDRVHLQACYKRQNVPHYVWLLIKNGNENDQ